MAREGDCLKKKKRKNEGEGTYGREYKRSVKSEDQKKEEKRVERKFSCN